MPQPKAATAPGATQLSETERQLQAQFSKLEEQFGRLKEQTRQCQKLASLGTAATMLAHEFNNLMTPVVGYAQYAIDSGDVELMIKALSMTLKQTGIVTAMSDRILGLAVNEAQSFQSVNVREAVDDAVACLCRDLSKDSITLETRVESNYQVWADPKQLQQVLFNLLINARQAISHRHGRIIVSARAIDDEQILLELRDNGAGIEAEDLNHIFDEFFSTKKGQAGKSGIGLGLSLCREIVEEHRGTISAQSTVGEGTTFSITLPSAG